MRRAVSRPARTVADLPYADQLVAGTLADVLGTDVDLTHFDGDELSDVDPDPTRFAECAFSAVSVRGGSLAGWRFSDCWFRSAVLTGADLVGSQWLDCALGVSVFAGNQAHGALLRRVTFENCKFDTVNFRSADLLEVSFVDCRLADVDFRGSTLRALRFPGSTLSRLGLAGCTMTDVDLRGAAALGISDGLGQLGGVRLTQLQALDLAIPLARHAGATVD